MTRVEAENVRWIEDKGGDVRPSICVAFTADGKEHRYGVKYQGPEGRDPAIQLVIDLSAGQGFNITPPEAT